MPDPFDGTMPVPESLRDRATRLWAHINGAKEELAEYTRLSEGVRAGTESLGAADSVFDELSESIRSIDAKLPADLLTALNAAEQERDSLRQLASDQQQTIARLLDQVQSYQDAVEFESNAPHREAFNGFGPSPGSWDNLGAAVAATQQREHEKLIGHYRAVLHDLSAPQQAVPEAARDGMDAAYLKANPLMAGGAPLGA